MRREKISTNALIPRAATLPDSPFEPSARASRNDLRIRGSRVADGADVCGTLFKFCKQCDENYLDPRKIQCLFDVDSGWMEQRTVDVVCGVIEAIVGDIAQHAGPRASGGSVTITLRQHHGVWILAITERRISTLAKSPTVRRLALVRGMAQKIDAACRVHETDEGYITALMFGVEVAKPTWHTASRTVH